MSPFATSWKWVRVPLIAAAITAAAHAQSAPDAGAQPDAARPDPSTPAEPVVGRSASITVSVVRNGQEITLTREEDRITVSYTGKDGERVTVQAKNEDELRQHPEAYQLYERYLGGGGSGVQVWGEVWGGRRPDGGDRRPLLERWQLGPRDRLPPGWRLELRQNLSPELQEQLQELRRHADEIFRDSQHLREWARELADQLRDQLQQWQESDRARPPRVERAPRAEAPPRADQTPRPERGPGAERGAGARAAAGRALGVEVAPPPPPLRAQFGDGVVVERVLPDSPAATAGLRRWDYVTSINGQPVNRPEAVREAVREAEGTVKLQVIREGKPLELSVTLPTRGGQ